MASSMELLPSAALETVAQSFQSSPMAANSRRFIISPRLISLLERTPTEPIRRRPWFYPAALSTEPHLRVALGLPEQSSAFAPMAVSSNRSPSLPPPPLQPGPTATAHFPLPLCCSREALFTEPLLAADRERLARCSASPFPPLPPRSPVSSATPTEA